MFVLPMVGHGYLLESPILETPRPNILLTTYLFPTKKEKVLKTNRPTMNSGVASGGKKEGFLRQGSAFGKFVA